MKTQFNDRADNDKAARRALKAALVCAKVGQFNSAQRWGEILIRRLELAGVFRAGSVSVKDARDGQEQLK